MDTIEEAKILIEKSQNILILPKKENQNDILGVSFGFLYALKKTNKNTTLILEKQPEEFQFLDPLGYSVGFDDCLKDVVISIDNDRADITKVRYEKNEKETKIYLTPKNNLFQKENITIDSSFTRPDLLITLGIKNT